MRQPGSSSKLIKNVSFGDDDDPDVGGVPTMFSLDGAPNDVTLPDYDTAVASMSKPPVGKRPSLMFALTQVPTPSTTSLSDASALRLQSWVKQVSEHRERVSERERERKKKERGERREKGGIKKQSERGRKEG